MSEVKGYKGFDQDLKCKDFQYEVGKTYTLDGDLELCKNGFHFCNDIEDIYSYYELGSRICEVTALGDVVGKGAKLCTNIIRIDKEITDPNIICCNSGDDNIGYFNEGNFNRGDYNQGNYNIGNDNIGNKNIGYYNGGNSNRGDYNIGNNNRGYCNEGNFNIGDDNVGDYNIGDRNKGDFNKGSCNIGDFNIGNNNEGLFNTNCNNDQFYMFNEPTDYDLDKWRNSEACGILKASIINRRSLDYKDMDIIKELPNFDENIFELIKTNIIDQFK